MSAVLRNQVVAKLAAICKRADAGTPAGALRERTKDKPRPKPMSVVTRQVSTHPVQMPGQMPGQPAMPTVPLAAKTAAFEFGEKFAEALFAAPTGSSISPASPTHGALHTGAPSGTSEPSYPDSSKSHGDGLPPQLDASVPGKSASWREWEKGAGVFWKDLPQPVGIKTIMRDDTGKRPRESHLRLDAERTQEPRALTRLFSSPQHDYARLSRDFDYAAQWQDTGLGDPTLRAVVASMLLQQRHPKRYQQEGDSPVGGEDVFETFDRQAVPKKASVWCQWEKAAAPSGPTVPARLLGRLIPMEGRRDLDPEEEQSASTAESRWLPDVIQHAGTPISGMLASPGKQGVLAGGLGAAAGGGLGYLAGQQFGGGGKGAAIGAALAALATGGHQAYTRHERNKELRESMHRLPKGATKQDLQGREMIMNAAGNRFGTKFSAERTGSKGPTDAVHTLDATQPTTQLRVARVQTSGSTKQASVWQRWEKAAIGPVLASPAAFGYRAPPSVGFAPTGPTRNSHPFMSAQRRASLIQQNAAPKPTPAAKPNPLPGEGINVPPEQRAGVLNALQEYKTPAKPQIAAPAAPSAAPI